MVAPLIAVAVGAQVVSGLMQYYQSEKAAGANKKRLQQIEAIFNKIVPPEADLSIFDDPRIAEEIPLPDLDLSKITPQEYKSVGQFVPEVASYVAETNPKLVQQTESAQTGRKAQMAALEKYREIAAGGFDPMLHQRLQEASRKAAADAQSRQQSVLQDAQRRGQFGSGLMLGSQMNQTADAGQRQAMESQLAAAEAYRNQLSALDKSASLGGDIRDSEMGEEARNTGIINDFNERTSKRYQDYLQYRADINNRANLRNVENQQDIANRNTSTGNDYQWKNRGMQNTGKQQQYQNQRIKKEDLLGTWRAKEDAKQRDFANKMDVANGKAGMQREWMNHNTGRAQDTNQAIRGVGDAIGAGAMYADYAGQKDQQQQPPTNQAPDTWDGYGNEDWGNNWKRSTRNRRY